MFFFGKSCKRIINEVATDLMQHCQITSCLKNLVAERSIVVALCDKKLYTILMKPAADMLRIHILSSAQVVFMADDL